MSRTFRMFQSTGLVRLLVGAAVTIGVFAPQPAVAQSSDSWKGTIAPFYLWATRINGDIATRAGTLPVFMTFDDAEHNLAGAFSFHFEAEKSRFGIFSDLDFVRLSTASAFTLQGPLAQTVSGDADVNNTFFEAGGSYLLSDKMPFAVIAGLRTFTLATNVEFTTPNVSVTPIDANRTAVSGFAGFTFRPLITDKLSFLSRADIGGGSGKSWSGMLGVEFRPKPWAGLVVGYKGMGIDFGKDTNDTDIRKVSLTYYGPICGLNLNWGAR